MVLFDHAVALGGFGGDAILDKTNPGTVAVYGFFGISGYLIAASATRNGVGRYLWQRALRIFPAFWICLIVTAFLFGTIGWLHGRPSCGVACYVREPLGPVDYVARNFLLRLNQPTIAHTLHGVPVPLAWNGSMWTLFYEFLCYLVLGVWAAMRLLRRRWTLLLLACLIWVAELVITAVPTFNSQFNILSNWDATALLTFLPVFLTGALLYLFRDVIPDSGILALVCVGAFIISLVVPLGNHIPVYTLTSSGLFAPAVAYPMLWLGIHLPLQKVGARNDYSYGVYIYAFPVSQLLALWGVYRWGYPAYVALVVLLTIPFAAASWWLVEKHALKFKTFDAHVFPRARALGSPNVAETALVTEGGDPAERIHS